jgi:hypothetical protein
MTRENKAKLAGYIKAMNAGGGTNMNDGMELAFGIFQATTRSSGCMKLLLFLTDGENSQDDDELLKACQNLCLCASGCKVLGICNGGCWADVVRNVPKDAVCGSCHPTRRLLTSSNT